MQNAKHWTWKWNGVNRSEWDGNGTVNAKRKSLDVDVYVRWKQPGPHCVGQNVATQGFGSEMDSKYPKRMNVEEQ